MKSVIMLIDDEEQEIKLMKDALKKELGLGTDKCKLTNGDELTVEEVPISAKGLTEDTFSKLVEKISGCIEKNDRVLLVIDLNLMGGDYYSYSQLRVNLLTGILLRRKIVKRLESEIADKKEQDKVKYIFVSGFFDRSSDLRKWIDVIIEGEKTESVSKPRKIWEEQKYDEETQAQEIKIQEEKYNYYEIINSYFAKKTLYGNFIGKILKAALA